MAACRPIVRCYLGDSEQRWFLWYSGRGTNDTDADCVQPSSGSVGEHSPWLQLWHSSNLLSAEHPTLKVRHPVGVRPERLSISGCCTRGSWHPGYNPQASSVCAGLAVSSNGVDWARGSGDVEGSSSPERAQEVGRVLKPNPDWWCFDTAHVTVSDVQVQMTFCWSVQRGHLSPTCCSSHIHLKLGYVGADG